MNRLFCEDCESANLMYVSRLSRIRVVVGRVRQGMCSALTKGAICIRVANFVSVENFGSSDMPF